MAKNVHFSNAKDIVKDYVRLNLKIHLDWSTFFIVS